MKPQDEFSDQGMFKSKEEALDHILKERHDLQQVEEWKKKIPLHAESNTKKYLILFFSILALGVASYFLFQFNSGNSQKQMANNLIHSTVIPTLSDVEPRGENGLAVNGSLAQLNLAIELLKNDTNDAFKAIKILEKLSDQENRYQIEATWFKALAQVKVGNYTNAIIDLERLANTTKYQSKNVNKLLEKLRS